MTCNKCKLSDVVVEKGSTFMWRNPLGHEEQRQHPSDIRICRANPPINGWPEVADTDWCGQFVE